MASTGSGGQHVLLLLLLSYQAVENLSMIGRFGNNRGIGIGMEAMADCSTSIVRRMIAAPQHERASRRHAVVVAVRS